MVFLPRTFSLRRCVSYGRTCAEGLQESVPTRAGETAPTATGTASRGSWNLCGALVRTQGRGLGWRERARSMIDALRDAGAKRRHTRYGRGNSSLRAEVLPCRNRAIRGYAPPDDRTFSDDPIPSAVGRPACRPHRRHRGYKVCLTTFKGLHMEAHPPPDVFMIFLPRTFSLRRCVSYGRTCAEGLQESVSTRAGGTAPTATGTASRGSWNLCGAPVRRKGRGLGWRERARSMFDALRDAGAKRRHTRYGRGDSSLRVAFL